MRASPTTQPNPSIGLSSLRLDESSRLHSFRWHLAAIGLTALVIRGSVFLELYNQLPFSTLITDSRVYDDWAKEIAAGNWLGEQVFYQSPLYPYAMAIIYKLTGYDPMHIRCVQAILGSLACVLVAVAGHYFIGNRAGQVAGWLLAIYAPAIFFDALIQKSSLDLFFMACILALMGRFLEVQRWPWVLSLGLSLGFLILNRENARVLYPVIATWLLIYFSHQPLGLRFAWIVALSIGCASVLVPVGIRNYRVGSEFLLTTSQFGPNFYIGNHSGASGLYEPLIPGRGHTMYERIDAESLAEKAMGRPLQPGEVSNYWRDQVFHFIRHSPWEWIRLMLWKSYLVLHGQELVDSEGIEVYAHHSKILRVLSWFNFGILVALSVLGGWATQHLWRRLSVLYLMLAAMAASVAIFFVFARYRFPMVPALMLMAGASLVSLPKMVQDCRNGTFLRRWGVGWAMAIVLLVSLNWPLSEYRDDAIAYANYGKELLDEGNSELAVAALREAVLLAPNTPGAQYNLGRAYELQGRTEEATRQYELTLRLDPDYGRAHWMLARQRIAIGDLTGAIPRLRRAVETLQELDRVHIDLGMVLATVGNSAEAAEQFRKALIVNPSSATAVNNLAWLLATSPDDSLRNGNEALALAQRLESLQEPVFLDTLAAVYAEIGRFEQAEESARLGRRLAEESGDRDLAEQLSRREQLYKIRQPYRDLK